MVTTGINCSAKTARASRKTAKNGGQSDRTTTGRLCRWNGLAKSCAPLASRKINQRNRAPSAALLTAPEIHSAEPQRNHGHGNRKELSMPRLPVFGILAGFAALSLGAAVTSAQESGGIALSPEALKADNAQGQV